MRLKVNLLIDILNNVPTKNKYSKAFLNLKNVFELEEKEKFVFSKSIIEQFNELSKRYNSFLDNIPLIIIERYYNTKSDQLTSYVILEFNNNELNSDLQIMNLFQELELFFEECFNLAVQIASLYNIEVKLNKRGEEETGEFF